MDVCDNLFLVTDYFGNEGYKMLIVVQTLNHFDFVKKKKS